MQETRTLRRRILQIGAATIAMVPLVIVGRADAATNASMRSALKYQAKPEGDKSCSGCMHFVPNPDAKKPGGCKLIQGDTEISPQGYCVGWSKKA